MGRKRSPKREETKKLYIQNDGKMTTKELSDFAGVSESKIRQWKSADGWDAALKDKRKRKRGAQKGNKNAKKPHNAGNKNAQKHGAYARCDIEKLSEEEKQAIEEAELFDIEENMRTMYRSLKAKEFDLERRIRELDENPDEMKTEKIIESGEEKTVIQVNRFLWIRKLEGELDRVRGRMMKLTDAAINKKSGNEAEGENDDGVVYIDC